MKQQVGRHSPTSAQNVPVAGTSRPLTGSWCREARASCLLQGHAGPYRQPFKLPYNDSTSTKMDRKSRTRCNIQELTPTPLQCGTG